MTPENKVKQSIKTILNQRGVYWCMPMGTIFGRSGVPDFLCCYKGRMLAIEAKAGGNKASALQLLELDKIYNAGGSALVINENNLDDIHYTLDSIAAGRTCRNYVLRK